MEYLNQKICFKGENGSKILSDLDGICLTTVTAVVQGMVMDPVSSQNM